MILAAILVIMKRFVLIINGLGMIKKGKKESRKKSVSVH